MKAKEVKKIKVRVELVRDGADNKVIAHNMEIVDEFDRSKRHITEAVEMLTGFVIDIVDGAIDD